jgi:hypothetical protein
VPHPGGRQPVELVLEEGHAADLQEVLGAVRRQRQQAAAETARHDDRYGTGALGHGRILPLRTVRG